MPRQKGVIAIRMYGLQYILGDIYVGQRQVVEVDADF